MGVSRSDADLTARRFHTFGREPDLLSGLAQVDGDALVGRRQGVPEVREGLAAVDDVLPLELEGQLAAELAVGLLRQGRDDGDLLDVRGRGERVVARAQHEVVDVRLADDLVGEEVGEGRVALFFVSLALYHGLRGLCDFRPGKRLTISKVNTEGLGIWTVPLKLFLDARALMLGFVMASPAKLFRPFKVTVLSNVAE